MTLPLPIKPIVTNANGERVLNPLLRSVRGITLQPNETQAGVSTGGAVTVPAAVGAQPGIANPVTFESPFAGYTEVFAFLDSQLASNKLNVFANMTCTRYGGRSFSNRPIPFPFMFGFANGRQGTNFGHFYPSFNEISFAPIIAPEQTFTLQLMNIQASTRTVGPIMSGRLFDSQLNATNNNIIQKEYDDRGRIQPYWLTCEQDIRVGGLNTNMPGLTFTASGSRQQTAMFINKYHNPFIITAVMVAAVNISGVYQNSTYSIQMFDRSYRGLSDKPIPLNNFRSFMSQPYFLTHPIVMSRGDEFRIDVSVTPGETAVNSNVVFALFGQSLI